MWPLKGKLHVKLLSTHLAITYKVRDIARLYELVLLYIPSTLFCIYLRFSYTKQLKKLDLLVENKNHITDTYFKSNKVKQI